MKEDRIIVTSTMLSQSKTLAGKYKLTTKPGCSLTYNFYHEYRLELTVDSTFLLKEYSYTSKANNANKMKFELTGYHKYRGQWTTKGDTIVLGLEHIGITAREGKLFINGEQMKKKRGYFIFRRKTFKYRF